MERTLRFELAKTTKGALQYKELDPVGSAPTLENTVIGTLYVRKTAFDKGEEPTVLEVTVKTV